MVFLTKICVPCVCVPAQASPSGETRGGRDVTAAGPTAALPSEKIRKLKQAADADSKMSGGGALVDCVCSPTQKNSGETVSKWPGMATEVETVSGFSSAEQPVAGVRNAANSESTAPGDGAGEPTVIGPRRRADRAASSESSDRSVTPRLLPGEPGGMKVTGLKIGMVQDRFLLYKFAINLIDRRPTKIMEGRRSRKTIGVPNFETWSIHHDRNG